MADLLKLADDAKIACLAHELDDDNVSLARFATKFLQFFEKKNRDRFPERQMSKAVPTVRKHRCESGSYAGATENTLLHALPDPRRKSDGLRAHLGC